MERGKLRRIFGKVAAVIAVAATFAFYGLGFQIGHAYYQEWQQNKAEVTTSWQQEAPKPTENLPWAATGVALVGAYGLGAAAIAAGKRKERGYSGGGYSSGYNNSSSNDGFFWGYMWGSSGRSGGSSSSSGSSKDNGGAAAAVVIVGAVALAAGASVVAYQAVKTNFFTGEEPLKEEWKWKTEVKDSPFGTTVPTNANQIPETTAPATWPPATQPAPEISEPGGKKAKPFSL